MGLIKPAGRGGRAQGLRSTCYKRIKFPGSQTRLVSSNGVDSHPRSKNEQFSRGIHSPALHAGAAWLLLLRPPHTPASLLPWL